MAIRFQRPIGTRVQQSPRHESGLGEWWAAIAVIAVACLTLASFPNEGETESERPTLDPTPEILAAVAPAQEALADVEAAFETLCGEPVLLTLGLEPDCETGVITLSDDLFDGFGSAQLKPDAREDIRAAVRSYLSRLRRLPALWDSLEAIEFRGHADPRAVRDPYATNLVGSQQRPLGLLLLLAGDQGLADADRE